MPVSKSYYKKYGITTLKSEKNESHSTNQEEYFAHIPAKIRTKFCSFANNF